MDKHWDDKFSGWASPPGQGEEQRITNTIKAIQDAINNSQKLQTIKTKVFIQGSYRNNTNVRHDSDVDIGIFSPETLLNEYPDGTDKDTFNLIPATYHYDQFKNEIGEALVAQFGVTSVKRGNKAFSISENTYRINADVTPFFEHRRYRKDGSYTEGVALNPDDGQPRRVINWPEQHYENGVNKNNRTGRSEVVLLCWTVWRRT